MNTKEAFREIYSGLLGKNQANESFKKHELKIKSVIAEKLGLTNKEGAVDAKKVKAPILKKTVVLELENKNKLKEDLDLQDEYHRLIKNGDIGKNDINRYGTLMDEIKNSNSEFNDIKKRLSTEIDDLDISILIEIAKEEISALSDDGNSKKKKEMTTEQLEAYIKKKKEILNQVKS